MNKTITPKKLISLLMAVTVILSLFGQSAASVSFEKGRLYENRPGLYQSTVPRDNITKSIDWDGLTNTLYKAIKAHKDKVNVAAYNIKVGTDDYHYLYDILYGHPDFFRTVTGGSYYTNNNMVTDILLSYRWTKSGFNMMVKTCKEAVSKITADLVNNTRLSTAEKILLIHDRLAVLSEYDLTNNGKGSIWTYPSEDYTAYGPLVLRRGVCEGYASAMYMCLKQIGVKSYLVSSSALNHTWNLVYLDGRPYFIDTTWDDPTWDVNGNVRHRDLLCSTAKLKESHTANDFTTLPQTTAYDNYYWSCSKSEFQFIDNNLYFIDNENETLCRKNYDGTISVLKSLDYTWLASANSHWGNYCRLASYAGWLIYSTPTEVYVYNKSTGESTLLYRPYLDTANYYYIYGMTVKDCLLYIDVNNSPNFDASTKNNYEIRVELSHVEQRVAAKPKVYCTDTGLTEGKICAICGKVLEEQKKIPPVDHVWGEETVSVCATPESDGTLVSYCVNCPKSKEKRLPMVSGITLSKTRLAYNGKARTPEVVVKNSKGNALSTGSYTLEWKNENSKGIGKYYVKVLLQGKYSGEKKLIYSIVPPKPQKLKAAAVSKSSVRLSWAASKGAEYYRVYKSTDGKNWSEAAKANETKVSVKGLKPGVKYQFRVKAYVTETKPSSTFSDVLKTQTLTAAPKLSKISSSKSKTVSVSWNAVTGAKNYIVYRSSNGRDWTRVKKVASTSASFGGLSGGSRVYVRVQSVNQFDKKGGVSAVKYVTVRR